MLSPNHATAREFPTAKFLERVLLTLFPLLLFFPFHFVIISYGHPSDAKFSGLQPQASIFLTMLWAAGQPGTVKYSLVVT